MKRVLVVGLACLAAGCSVSPAYYWQAAGGQFELWRRSQQVAELLADPNTPPELQQRLQLARALRDFASAELALPQGNSYRSYADLQRPAVVWNVFATPALSIRPREWCLPVAGCVAYLGYFSEADARAHAARLRDEGMDVYVGSVPAYSTLGWFDDPLLNTFIRWPETELARLIFHELAHRLLYVKDDTAFNESFASAVEEIGVRRWMAQPGKTGLVEGFERAQRMRADFAALVVKYRDELAALYASGLSDDEKRRRKTETIAALRAEYAAIKAGRWGGAAGYDRWFGQDINNATLASVGLYRRWVPAFEQLFAREGGDLARFYAAARRLAAEPQAAREAQLQALLDDAAKTALGHNPRLPLKAAS